MVDSEFGGRRDNGDGATAVAAGPGRPRKAISMEEVANVAAALFSEGGYDAISIEAVAERLSVSRATLYRNVPSKEHLLGIVLERYTTDLGHRAEEFLAHEQDPGEALIGLIRIQVDAAIRTKEYFAVVAGGTGVHSSAYKRWQRWSHDYESLWHGTVQRAMDAGILSPADPVVSTRLILGMLIWVSRWYRDTENYTTEQIADVAIGLIFSGKAS